MRPLLLLATTESMKNTTMTACATLLLILGQSATAMAQHHPTDHRDHGHQPRVPLIFDLNGDGVHATSPLFGVLFDLDGDGKEERTAWTNWDSEEGFLCLDLNNNGEIDSGQELFGPAMVMPDDSKASNGFAALAFFDRMERGGNADGEISNEDEIWPRLRIWVDRDHDGSALGELQTLEEAQVTSIPLQYTESFTLDGGSNWHWLIGHFRRTLTHRGKEITLRFAVEGVYLPSSTQRIEGPPTPRR